MDVLHGGLGADAALGSLVALDSILPVLPSEALVIAASAVGGPARAIGVLLTAAVGALTGDVLVHVLGRRSHDTRLGRWLRCRPWMRQDRLGVRGALIWGRFVPGGRTCISFLSGVTHVRWQTYLPAAAAGSLLWATYVTALGRLGDRLAMSPFVSIILGIALGLVISSAITLIVRRRTPHRPAGPPRQRQLAAADR